jgi:cold shock CspA family protein
MGRSQETYSKKEREKNKVRKRQDKEMKREERKANSDKGKSLEDMMAYVDENGNISNMPPDPKKKKEIIAEEISLVPAASIREEEKTHTGKITMFNTDKGYGFIKDSETREGVFVHIKNCLVEVKENDVVFYEIETTPKGVGAINVRLKA